MEVFNFIYWDHSFNDILALNLVIVIALFSSLRLFSGAISHINASDELLKKDNAAFGLSLASVTFAVTIVLSGVSYGNIEGELFNSAISVGLYGLIAIVLMAITRLIFDKITLPHISLRKEIIKGNIAVAIADSANVIAAALIIRTIMVWITFNNMEAIGTLLAVYAISQLILTSATVIYLRYFKIMFAPHSIQRELKEGNVALALSFAGGKIMAALGISIASGIVVYELYEMPLTLVAWTITSIIFILVLKVISLIAVRVILFRTHISKEILEDKNIAIGAFQAVIYISIGILLAEL